jgi:capsular exopolysaccharide synthesis family protein
MDPMNRPALPAPRPSNPVEPVGHPQPAPPPAVPAAPPPILSGAPNVWNLLAAFRRRWRLAVSLGVLVAAVAGVVTYFVANPSAHTAVALLHVDSQRPQIMFATHEPQPSFDTYQRTQASLVRSRIVLNAALRDSRVNQLPMLRDQPDQLEFLEGKVSANFALSPEIMQIQITDKDRESALILVEAVRDAYLREIVEVEKTRRLEHFEQIKKLYREFEEKLKAKRMTLKSYAEVFGGTNPLVVAARQQLAAKEMEGLMDQLQGIRKEILSETFKLNQEKDLADELEKGAVPEEEVEKVLAQDLVIANLRKDIDRAELEKLQWHERLQNPTNEQGYKDCLARLASLNKVLVARRADQRPKVEAELRETLRQTYQQRQVSNRKRLSELKRLDESYVTKMEEAAKSTRTLGEKGLYLDGINDDIKVLQTAQEKIAAESLALETETGAPPRIAIMDQPYSVKRDTIAMKMAVGAGVVGFLVIIAGVSFLEFLSRRVNTVADVARGLRLPVVGTLPLVKSRAGGSVGKQSASSAWHQLLIESVDAARTVLLHASRRKSLQVVMVTSATAGEGKTMLSAHLAASLARAGWRVLLVDGDMRRPSLHKVFGVEARVGLGEVLRGDANIRECVQAGPMPGLWLVPAGGGDTQSLRTLAQGGLKGIFEAVKKEYDFIILDSAPILPVVDSQLMAQAVDGVIISVLQNVSRLPWVYAAYERLSLFQIELLGAVVHGSTFGAYGTKYPYLPFPSQKAAAAPVTPVAAQVQKKGE